MMMKLKYLSLEYVYVRLSVVYIFKHYGRNEKEENVKLSVYILSVSYCLLRGG